MSNASVRETKRCLDFVWSPFSNRTHNEEPSSFRAVLDTCPSQDFSAVASMRGRKLGHDD